MVEFMLQNVVYRASVYRTGSKTSEEFPRSEENTYSSWPQWTLDKAGLLKILLSKPYPRTYLQLPLQQWGAGNVFVLSSWKVNIAENLIAVMGL